MDDAAGIEPIWSLQSTLADLHCSALTGRVEAAHPDWGLRKVTIDHFPVEGTVLKSCFRTLLLPQQKSSNLTSGIPTAFPRAIRSDDAPKEPAEGDGGTNDWPLPVADVYVRGNDLVANYRPTDGWPYAPQLYWQANTLSSVEGVRAALSLLVSVQTDLLDSWPNISVVSKLSSSEQLRIMIGEGEQASVAPIERDERLSPNGATLCLLQRLTGAPISYAEIVSSADYCFANFAHNGMGNASIEWALFADFLEKGVIRRARVHAAFLPRECDVDLAIECCAAIEQSPLPLTA
jgi:hypothetical protein